MVIYWTIGEFMIKGVSTTMIGACAALAIFWSSSCTPPIETFPETCADLQEQIVAQTGNRPSDGTYTLFIEGNEAMPWQAYCRRMNLTSPIEYLTVDEQNNFAQIGNGQSVAVTNYRRYRIDPIRLEINPLDDSFAVNDAGFDQFTPVLPVGMSYIPAGWAEFQPVNAFDGPAAESRASLAGTAFVFSESILANNLADFFCQVDTPETDSTNTAGTGAEVSSDLTAFHLTAINSNPENSPSGVSTREVADCANLGPTAQTFTSGSWPLQYVGE